MYIAQKWSFPFRISSANVTRLTVLVTFTDEIVKGKFHFLCSDSHFRDKVLHFTHFTGFNYQVMHKSWYGLSKKICPQVCRTTRDSCPMKHRELTSFMLSNNFLTDFLSFYRHVQVSNDGAIEFYRNFGFEIIETKTQYYKRIEPADAYVLQKTLRQVNTKWDFIHSCCLLQIYTHFWYIVSVLIDTTSHWIRHL